jgi:hypothetical protein
MKSVIASPVRYCATPIDTLIWVAARPSSFMRDQRFGIDTGLALVRHLVDRLHLGVIVGNRSRKKILRRAHKGVEPLGRVDDDGTHLGRDVGLEQILIGPDVEGPIVIDQEIDRVAQIVMASREILEPDGEIGRRGRDPLFGHAPHRPFGNGRGIVVIGIVEAGVHHKS